VSDPDHKAVTALYLRLVDLQEIEARLVLDQERARQPHVVSRVEEMLARERVAAEAFPSASILAEDSGQWPGPITEDDEFRIGSLVLHYRLIEKVGEGASGTVWKAEDGKLGRTVALKILRDRYRDDPEALVRFRKEARILAHLGHRGLVTIHAVEEWRGRPVLAMEFIPGETLAQRLQDGRPLPLEEAVEMARLLAETLGSAHGQGIVHRDFKPANIKISPEGNIRVLDFGLAKGFGAALEITESESMRSAFDGTLRGTIMGTPSYMSPQQARGEALDTKADVWAFGCVLYEMLTGRRAFLGSTFSDTITEILSKEPDWSCLPEATPSRVRRLLRWCFRKDAARRLANLDDAASELALSLEECRHQETASPIFPIPALAPNRPFRPSGKSLCLGALAGVAAGLVWLSMHPQSTVPAVQKRHLTLPLSTPFSAMSGAGRSLTFAPDGLELFYNGRLAGETTMFTRPLNSPESFHVPGTKAVEDVFFDDTSAWLGMRRHGAIWKVLGVGGVPQRLAPATGPGADWSGDRIVYVPTGRSGIAVMNSDGEQLGAATALRDESGDVSHRWPAFFSSHDGIVFVIHKEDDLTFAEGDLAVVLLQDGQIRPLGFRGTAPMVAAGNTIIYEQHGRLLAATLDTQTLTIIGEPWVLAEDLSSDPVNADSRFALARDGTLAYVPGSATTPERSLHILGPDGQIVMRRRDMGGIRHLSVSKANRLAAVSTEPAARLLVAEATDGPLEPIAGVLGVSSSPVWGPEDRTLVVSVESSEGTSLLLVQLDGTPEARVLLPPGPERIPECITPDGERLIYAQRNKTTGLDLKALALEAPNEQSTVRGTPADESDARLSPNGRWLAFVSNESGQHEIHLQYMAGRAAHFQVTNSGGCCPVWSENGKVLYFAVGDEIRTVTMPADVDTPGRSSNHAGLPPGSRLTGPASSGGVWIMQESPPFSAHWVTVLRGWQRRPYPPGRSERTP